MKYFVSYFSSPLKSFSGPGSGRPVFQLSSTLRYFNPLTRKRTLVFLTLLSYATTLNKCTKFTGHSQLSKSGSRTVLLLHRVSFFPYFGKLYIYSTRVCCGLVGLWDCPSVLPKHFHLWAYEIALRLYFHFYFYYLTDMFTYFLKKI